MSPISTSANYLQYNLLSRPPDVRFDSSPPFHSRESPRFPPAHSPQVCPAPQTDMTVSLFVTTSSQNRQIGMALCSTKQLANNQ